MLFTPLQLFLRKIISHLLGRGRPIRSTELQLLNSFNLTFAALWVGMCLLMLLGCAPSPVVDELASADTRWVNGSDAVGQSFVARHAGLQSIAVHLQVAEANDDLRLRLHVRSSADINEPDIRTVEKILPTPLKASWYQFDFAPLADSHKQIYFFALERLSPNRAAFALAQLPETAYRDGAMYVAGRPVEAQLMMRLGYAPELIVLDLVAWWWSALKMMGVLCVLFVLPGLAIQTYALPLTLWRARFALSVGLSVSLYTLLILYAKMFNVTLGVLVVWLPMTLATLALLWRYASRARWMGLQHDWREWKQHALPSIVWGGVAGLVLFARLFLLRSIDTPMLGDSVQHAAISQLLLDHGGLFDSWLPYAPYATMTTHFGFHTIVAALAWLTGDSVLDATLLAGQFINFAAILSLTLLAERLTQNRWAGIGVLLIAGLLLPLPYGYTYWGRYSQLAGQAIMPVGAWLIWRMFSAEDDAHLNSWSLSILTTLIFVGTFLAYYRMPYYVLLFALVIAVGWLRAWKRGWRAWLKPFSILCVSGVLTAALLSPWLIRLSRGALAEGATTGILQKTPLEMTQQEYQIFLSIDPYLPVVWVVVAACIVWWAIVKRHQPILIVASWGIGIALLPALRLLRVPGSDGLQGFAIVISLYMPVSLLAGYSIDALCDWVASARAQVAHTTTWLNSSNLRLACLLIGLMLVSLWGVRERLQSYDMAYRMLTFADLRAMQWIRANVPESALFLVDGFPVYAETVVVGSDAGWWLPILTRRPNTMPPEYALLLERPIEPDYNRSMINLVTLIRRMGVAAPETLALLCRTHITHVYVGQERGRIGIGPVEPMLSLTALEHSPTFTPIYRQDKVGIFALNDSACR